jgi:hypothetical protein
MKAEAEMRMRSIHTSLTLALAFTLASGAALADQAAGAAPGKDEPGTVHINAIKNPELHTYRAIVAGLDMFDEQHALAPNVPQLRFEVQGRGGKPLGSELPVARIAADDFSIPLVLDQQARFSVPRSQAAYEAKAELILNRKKREARVVSYVRTPGLPDNRYRLGDVRLDCKVKIAIAKEEIPFWVNGLVNSILLTSDWCSWFKGETPKGGDRTWSHEAGATLAKAVLYDGNRSMNLHVRDRKFEAPIGDTSWSNDAIVELEFAPPAEPAPADPSAATQPVQEAAP